MKTVKTSLHAILMATVFAVIAGCANAPDTTKENPYEHKNYIGFTGDCNHQEPAYLVPRCKVQSIHR